MKMGYDQVRQQVFRVMLKHDGNRARAAEDLNVSIRTFYRYLDEQQLHPLLERCGWHHHAGPPRGNNSRSIVYGLVKKHIRVGRGYVDLARLAMEVFSEDSPAIRQKLFTTLESMRRAGHLSFDGVDRWTVLKGEEK